MHASIDRGEVRTRTHRRTQPVWLDGLTVSSTGCGTECQEVSAAWNTLLWASDFHSRNAWVITARTAAVPWPRRQRCGCPGGSRWGLFLCACSA